MKTEGQVRCENENGGTCENGGTGQMASLRWAKNENGGQCLSREVIVGTGQMKTEGTGQMASLLEVIVGTGQI